MDTIDIPAETTVYLKDYAPAPFLISKVDLDIDLVSEDNARVEASLVVDRNRQSACLLYTSPSPRDS